MATNMNSSNVFSNHGKRLMMDTFNGKNNIKVIYSKEFLYYDGYDKKGSLPDIWDLYVCVQDISTGIYTYYYYNTETYCLDKKDNLKYELYSNSISSKYLVMPYSPGEFFGDTHSYMNIVFRVVNKINGLPEYAWNKLSKNHLESVNIYLHGEKLDPFTVVQISDN
jgi:hypothetical protein